MTYVSIADKVHESSHKEFVFLPFYYNGTKLEGNEYPQWGMTLKAAGNTRFRWNETNSNRIRIIEKISSHNKSQKLFTVQPELIHSKKVFYATDCASVFGLQGDGTITLNKNLLTAVTIADCMPIFLFDIKTGMFGALHSGWKGTGIVAEAFMLAKEKICSNPDDICVAIGPHIHDCCYIVDEQRAEYFSLEFAPECVVPVQDGEDLCKGNPQVSDWNNRGGKLYRLSLEKANLSVMKKIGIKCENIVVAKDCTCCNELFGSFRRETSTGISFTVQTGFCGFF